MDDSVRAIFLKQKEKINLWLRKKIERMVMQLFSRLKPKIKVALKDPDMCECVKKSVDELVDELWPDIEEEMRYQLK